MNRLEATCRRTLEQLDECPTCGSTDGIHDTIGCPYLGIWGRGQGGDVVMVCLICRLEIRAGDTTAMLLEHEEMHRTAPIPTSGTWARWWRHVNASNPPPPENWSA